MSIGLPDGRTSRRSIRRVDRHGRLESPMPDVVVVEEPLEIRIAGEALATTMRTPGHDHQLALGFLFAEGLITATDDVSTVAHCGRPGDESFGNMIEISPGAGLVFDPGRLKAARRGTLTTSACGVCGREQIEDLLSRVQPVRAMAPIDVRVLQGATKPLAAQQQLFQRTGAVHAAAALSDDGSVMAFAEDIGRHNAVDKVLGQLLLAELIGDDARPPYPRVLVVSGRTSFEIVQKAAAAQIGAVVSVSGVSSLAIDLAEAAGITLVGFAREGGMNVYAHPERIREAL